MLRSQIGATSSSLTATMLAPSRLLGGAPTSVVLSARTGLIWAILHTHIIVRVTTSGSSTIVAGKLNRAGYKDGKPADSLFNFGYWLSGITELPSGDLVFTDPLNHAIRYLRSDESSVATFAGSGRPGYQDGALNISLFDHPTGLVCANTGAIFVCDTHNRCVRMIKDNMVSTLGTGPDASGDSTLCDFTVLSGIAYHPKGQLLVADAMDHSLSRVTQNRCTSLTGSTQGYLDGAIDEARLCEPAGLALTPLSDLLVCDSGNSAIRILTGGQICTVFAPQGTPAMSLSSQVPGAKLNTLFPRAVVLGAEGVLYVADVQGIVVLSGPVQSRPTPTSRKLPLKTDLQKAVYAVIHSDLLPLIDIFLAQRQNLDANALLLRIVKCINLLISKCGTLLVSSVLDEKGEKALCDIVGLAVGHVQELTNLVLVSPFSPDINTVMGKLKACLISFGAIINTSN